MNNIVLIISCICECMIGLNDKKFIVKANNKLSLHINFKKNIYLNATPINSSFYLPFLFSLEYNNFTLESKSNNVYIVELTKNTYYVYIFPPINNNFNFQTYENIFKGKHIRYSNNELTITDKSNIKTYKIEQQLNKYEISICENTIVFFCKNGNFNNFYLFNIINGKNYSLKASQYSFSKNLIKCANSLHTYAHHTKVKTFNASTLELIEEYYAYEKNPRTILPKHIIPYAFLQNIFAEDYKLAQSLLDDKIFTKSINKTIAEQFFGNFTNICVPQIQCPPFCVGLLYKKNKNTYFCRYFIFELKDNKIINITEFTNDSFH